MRVALLVLVASLGAALAAVPDPANKAIYTGLDDMTFFAIGQCPTGTSVGDAGGTKLDELVAASLELTPSGYDFGVVCDSLDAQTSTVQATVGATLVTSLGKLKARLTQSSAGAHSTTRTFDPTKSYTFGVTTMAHSAQANTQLFNASITTLPLYYQKALNYTATVNDLTEHSIKFVVLDTESIVHGCRGGCQNETAQCTAGFNTTHGISTTDCNENNKLDERIAWARAEIAAAQGVNDYVFLVGEHCPISLGDTRIDATTNSTAPWGFPELRSKLLEVLVGLRPTAYVCFNHKGTQVIDVVDAKVPIIGLAACNTGIAANNLKGTNAILDKRMTPGAYRVLHNSTEPAIGRFHLDKQDGLTFSVVGLDSSDLPTVLYTQKLARANGKDDPTSDPEVLSLTESLLIALCVVAGVGLFAAIGVAAYRSWSGPGSGYSKY